MVIGVPNTKCPHGVFLAGEPVARYCSFCNPASAYGYGISGGQGEPIPVEPLPDTTEWDEIENAPDPELTLEEELAQLDKVKLDD
ncbi:Uncharacterised protein [uncultured archaeon]|nr:Uncharacterised protein [uncultured archaeon]